MNHLKIGPHLIWSIAIVSMEFLSLTQMIAYHFLYITIVIFPIISTNWINIFIRAFKAATDITFKITDSEHKLNVCAPI